MTSFEHVTLGRIVVYRSRTGDYSVPAIIAATQDSLYRPNVEAGYIPDLSKPDNVHLTVFSPGPGGKRADAADFLVEPAHGRSENQGGTYTEYDISFSLDNEPGTWSWPVRS